MPRPAKSFATDSSSFLPPFRRRSTTRYTPPHAAGLLLRLLPRRLRGFSSSDFRPASDDSSPPLLLLLKKAALLLYLRFPFYWWFLLADAPSAMRSRPPRASACIASHRLQSLLPRYYRFIVASHARCDESGGNRWRWAIKADGGEGDVLAESASAGMMATPLMAALAQVHAHNLHFEIADVETCTNPKTVLTRVSIRLAGTNSVQYSRPATLFAPATMDGTTSTVLAPAGARFLGGRNRRPHRLVLRAQAADYFTHRSAQHQSMWAAHPIWRLHKPAERTRQCARASPIGLPHESKGCISNRRWMTT